MLKPFIKTPFFKVAGLVRYSKKSGDLHNCGNTTEATTTFYQKNIFEIRVKNNTSPAHIPMLLGNVFLLGTSQMLSNAHAIDN